MLEWVKASYSEGQVQDTSVVGTIRHIGTNGRYHVYKLHRCNLYFVVFDNQGKLLNYINDNIYSVFMLKLLLHTNNKYKYNVEIDGEMLEVFTVARAVSIVPGTEEDPRTVRLNGQAVIIQ